MSIEQIAENWACEAHRSTNHLYDGVAYEIHLAMVFGIAKRYIHLVPQARRSVVLAACWAHDTIEDCRKTYNDVKEALGGEVAEIVFAVTNEKGRTRKERASLGYYKGIRMTEGASFVKICDRLANIIYSVNNKSKMLSVYRKEQSFFESQLGATKFDEMFDEINLLLGLKN